MSLPRRPTIVSLTIWCLLCSWLCFGALEMLEKTNLLPEVEDLDEAALVQVASGLRSEVSSHNETSHSYVATAAAEPMVWVSHPVRQDRRVIVQTHSPPSLRLHQQLSVYRI